MDHKTTIAKLVLEQLLGEFSLAEFIEFIFTSLDSFIKQRVGLFYSNDGPSKITKLWNRSVPRRHKASYTKTLVGSTVKVLQADLRKLQNPE